MAAEAVHFEHVKERGSEKFQHCAWNENCRTPQLDCTPKYYTLNKTGGWETFIFCLEVSVNRKTTPPPSGALESVGNQVRAPWQKEALDSSAGLLTVSLPEQRNGKSREVALVLQWGQGRVDLWSKLSWLSCWVPTHQLTIITTSNRGAQNIPLWCQVQAPQSYIPLFL